jgi:GNAT superfamily N-acetyltransferase
MAVRHARARELGDVAALLAEAFPVSPIGDWLVPDPIVRRQVYLEYFAIQVDHAHEWGQIDLAQDPHSVAGVVVWFRETTPPPEPDDYTRRLERACGSSPYRFHALHEILNRHSWTSPHHRLAFLAVNPIRHGYGIGSALLDHYHTRIAEFPTPASLVASTRRSHTLYLRHGYTPATTAPLHLPDSGPPLWPTFRCEQPPKTAATRNLIVAGNAISTEGPTSSEPKRTPWPDPHGPVPKVSLYEHHPTCDPSAAGRRTSGRSGTPPRC